MVNKKMALLKEGTVNSGKGDANTWQYGDAFSDRGVRRTFWNNNTIKNNRKMPSK
jgi:hypothetical protein